MREPMDMLQSRFHTAVIFVASAQSAKTQALILNWVAYSALVDGMDMIIFSPTQQAARDFSIRRIDRLHRYSPEIRAAQMPSRDADNVYDKHYRNGMMLNLGHPTIAQLAGRPVGRIALTDYDRMPDDVDDEGSPFLLASKRATTFGSFAMTVAESSPSREVENPNWVPKTPHEAPPCKGILGLYNQGDRRRWFWPCPHCDTFFEGKWEQIVWDDKGDNLSSAETARLICPVNGCTIVQNEKYMMLENGRWLKDGQSIDPGTHETVGDGVRSLTVSYWLPPVASGFMNWTVQVLKYLNAVESYEKTTSEEELRTFYNNDLGLPYLPKSAQAEFTPGELMKRAEPFTVMEMPEDERVERDPMLQPTVPKGVRFLVAMIDVQNNLFVVQVHGIIPGSPTFDLVVIDRFQIRKSQRLDHQGDALWVRPAAYLEDWDEIISQVMDRTYPLDDESGRRMGVRMTGCDSGGRAGVTTNAYNFHRKIRREGRAGKFTLLKGDGLLSRPRAQITTPDSNRRDKLSVARGDVPVLILNSNLLKDAVRGRLSVLEPGKGMIRFPSWLKEWFFTELCVETRDDKGWHNIRNLRNESWDLLYYCLGVCVGPVLSLENKDWTDPPAWAAEWDENELVTVSEIISKFQGVPDDDYSDFGAFAKKVAS